MAPVGHDQFWWGRVPSCVVTVSDDSSLSLSGVINTARGVANWIEVLR